jgi:hypothetical protein
MSQSVTHKTPQYMQNESFDPDFNLQTFELLGHDSANATMRRVQVDSSGNLKIDPTNLDARYLTLNQTTPQTLSASPKLNWLTSGRIPYIDENGYLTDTPLVYSALRGTMGFGTLDPYEGFTLGWNKRFAIELSPPNTGLWAEVTEGYLPAGRYYIAATSRTEIGETNISTITYVDLEATGGIKVSFDPVIGASHYRVYFSDSEATEGSDFSLYLETENNEVTLGYWDDLLEGTPQPFVCAHSIMLDSHGASWFYDDFQIGNPALFYANVREKTITINGEITADNLNLADWDEAHGWGNHAGLYGLLASSNVWAGDNTFSQPITLANGMIVESDATGYVKLRCSGQTYNRWLRFRLNGQYSVGISVDPLSNGENILFESSAMFASDKSFVFGTNFQGAIQLSKTSGDIGIWKYILYTETAQNSLGYVVWTPGGALNTYPTTSVYNMRHRYMTKQTASWIGTNWYDFWVTGAGARAELGPTMGSDYLLGADLTLYGRPGTERVTNGHFDTNSTGWTLNTDWSRDTTNKRINKVAGNTNTAVWGSNAPSAGATYIVVWRLIAGTAGSVTPSYGGVALTAQSVSGEYTEFITATDTTNFTLTPTTDFNGGVDDISIKLIGSGNLKLYGTLMSEGLILPTATSPSVSVEGQVAWDSDDDKLVAYDGANTVTIGTKIKSMSFKIETPTDADDILLIKVPRGIVITQVSGKCTGGTNVVGQLQEYDNDGANPADTQESDTTFTTSQVTNTTFSNSSIDKDDWLGWKTTSVSGSVSWLDVTIYYYEV